MAGQDTQHARFNETIDAALMNGGTVRIVFRPDGIRQVHELMQHFVTKAIIILPTQQEIDLRRRMASGDAEGCVVDATLTTTFPKKRRDFERRILPGIEELTLVAQPPT